MKSLLTALCLLLLLSGASFAETRYISDTLIVTIRDQPVKGAQVLTTVRTGAALEILEDQKEYLLVRAADGTEGYIRSQYVSSELPKAQQLKQLKEENADLQQRIDKLSTNLDSSDQKVASLDTTAQELARVEAEYQALQQSSDNVVQITRERDQLLQENSDLTERMQLLKEENSLYLRTAVIKWFFAGAGVLFFGWVMGKISRKKRRNYI